MNSFQTTAALLLASAGLAAPAAAVVPLTISYNTTTAQSASTVLEQFQGPGTFTNITTSASAATPATLSSFNTSLGILTGARLTVSIPYTLTVSALAPTTPNSGPNRTVDVTSTMSASVSIAGASIVGSNFATDVKCNAGDCANGSSNNTKTFTGTFGGTQAVATANLAQLATGGVGSVGYTSSVLGTNTTVINGSGIISGGPRTVMTLGSTTTANNQYSIAYDYIKRSTPSFNPSTVQTTQTINLGTRFADDGPFTQSFTIANIGDANTAGTSLIGTARSANDTRFSTSFTALSDLAAGSQQNFNLSFSPTAAGSFTETFTFTMQDHAPGGVGLVATPLVLTANVQIINRALPSFDPIANLLNQTLDFGTINLRDGPVTLNFTLFNQGNSNSAGLQLLSSSNSNNQFASSLTSLTNLAGGLSQMYSVTFTPTTTGSISGLLSYVVADYAPGVTGTPRQTTLSIATIANVFDPVPEPQSWAMLIAGFGLTGASLRRRRAAAC